MSRPFLLQALPLLFASLLAGLIYSFHITPVQADGGGLEEVTTYQGTVGLRGVNGIAISPDHRYVYVPGFEADALVVFNRDQQSGTLTLVEQHFNGINGVEGLSGAWAVAVSSDGRHIYVTGYWDNAVAIFAREVRSGRLSFMGTIKDGDEKGGVDGLFGASTLILSPDDHYLYVTGQEDEALAILKRDQATGQLTFVETIQEAEPISSPWDRKIPGLLISPDGQYLYMTSFQKSAINIFARDKTEGRLVFVDQIEVAQGLYSEQKQAALAISPDGQNIYTATSWDGGVNILARNEADGRLNVVQVITSTLPGLEAKPASAGKNFHALAISPDNRHIYVTQGDNNLAILARDPAKGTLTLSRVITGSQPVSGVYETRLSATLAMVASPDGRYIYTIGHWFPSPPEEDGSRVTVLSRAEQSGDLTFVEQRQSSNTGLIGLRGIQGMVLSPDDQNLYVVNTLDKALTIFNRDKATGALTFVEALQDKSIGGDIEGLNSPRSVMISPDGRHLYVANTDEGAIAIFNRGDKSGNLTFMGVITAEARGVIEAVLSPDGQQLYQANSLDSNISIFRRDLSSGSLVSSQVITSIVAGPDGLSVYIDRPRAIRLSPDSRHIYVTSGYGRDGALAVFSRMDGNGWLQFTEVITNGAANPGGTVKGLIGPSDIVISPDGQYLYVLGNLDGSSLGSALTSFRRDQESGRLTFTQVVTYETVEPESSESSGYFVSLLMSPDGQWLYTGSEGRLASFSRDQQSGQLTFEGLSSGPKSPNLLVTDSQGKLLYVEGGETDSLILFRTTPVLSSTTLVGVPVQAEVSKPIAPCYRLTLFKKEDVYLVTPDGSERIFLMHSPQRFFEFAEWSPDGSRLAYETFGPKNNPGSLWTVKADGTDRKMVTMVNPYITDGYHGVNWDWLPDSRYLIYQLLSPGHNSTQYISLEDVETGKTYDTSYESPYTAPYFEAVPGYTENDWVETFRYFSEIPLNVSSKKWVFGRSRDDHEMVVHKRHFSPDKMWLVLTLYEGKQVNYLARSDGSIFKPYPQPKAAPADKICGTASPYGDYNTMLAWAPDSRGVIFATYEAGQAELWRVEVETELETRLMTFPASGCPVGWEWSPDRGYATFSVVTGQQGDQDLLDIYVVNWARQQAHLALSGIPQENFEPKWSSETGYVLLTINPDTMVWDGNNQEITIRRAHSFPEYDCNWSPDGRYLACPGAVLDVITQEVSDAGGFGQWSGNSRWVANLSQEGVVTVFDVMAGQTRQIDEGVGILIWTPCAAEEQ